MTPHLLQGQRRGSGEGATLKHLRAQGALLTLVLADGGVVHHGQERVLAIPQAGENILKQQKKKKQKTNQGGLGGWTKGRPFVAVPCGRRCSPVHSCRLFICSRLMQAKSHYVQHGWTRGSSLWGCWTDMSHPPVLQVAGASEPAPGFPASVSSTRSSPALKSRLRYCQSLVQAESRNIQRLKRKKKHSVLGKNKINFTAPGTAGNVWC